MSTLQVIILAAGEGTRFKSTLPKVLHKVGGLPMVSHVVLAARAAGCDTPTVVVGPDQSIVEAAVLGAAPEARIARQKERLGTGHAVREARAAYVSTTGNVIVLYGDGPMIRPDTINDISARLDAGADMVVVAFEPEDPLRYGRLLIKDGQLLAIREYNDASEDERKVRLCNSGIMGFRAEALRQVIDRIDNKNAKGEYYLTDAVELANARNMRVAHTVAATEEVLGIDDRTRLAYAETLFQQTRREDFMKAGVTLHDPQTAYFSYDTEIAPDVTIEPGVFFGPGVRIESGAIIRAFSHIEGAHVGSGAIIGPFARLRPGADITENAHVGNFCEVKNATVGEGAKVNHLSYIGDADVGARTNIGAGTITCNYDGLNKHRTRIGADAFIGSDSALVAPVSIGDGAYVGSGSVITDNVPAGDLAIARGRQVNKSGYAAKIKARNEAIKAEKAKGRT
jgi:bifunctional UDP-N-acetylglucosamine pyrophosphorylase/glucosamine-1-phosphate N-acetyltransferase